MTAPSPPSQVPISRNPHNSSQPPFTTGKRSGAELSNNSTPTASHRPSSSLRMSPSDPSPELSAFSCQYSHLPTPQSPVNIGQYVVGIPFTPESPVPHGSQSSQATFRPPQLRFAPHPPGEEPKRILPSGSQQTMTPESSPPVPRIATSAHLATELRSGSLAALEDGPKTATSSLALGSSALGLAPAHSISPPTEPSNHSSQLSSPFMAKLSLSERNLTTPRTLARSTSPSPIASQPIQIDDVFSAAAPPTSAAISTPPISPPPRGGEMERIRMQILEEKMAAFQEAESRRPEYLRRTKRTLVEADLDSLDIGKDREGVGIMESPNKGRRLKLFQETSEESFEESLMAGGYGRYRTVEQPIPGPPEPVNVVDVLDKHTTPSPKELMKRKRLAAFTKSAGDIKLYPVEVEGRGRVLLDVPVEPAVADPIPSKKRVNKRKKKGSAPEVSSPAKYGSMRRDGEVAGPDWPDTEFPWRLRTEERVERAREEQEEKLRWIEKFLDRDTEEEEEPEEVLPSFAWGQEYDDPPMPSRRGRGKMVPLKPNPNTFQKRRNAFFPSDPGDARAALLSKRSVRLLSYRNQRRRASRWTGDDADLTVCVCDPMEEDERLVQCDSCQKWYHLKCIGVNDVAELGNEEDPWYCTGCATRTPTPEPLLTSEPTFVPTDEEPRATPSYDATLYQPTSEDSPMTPWASSRVPRTPTQNGNFGPAFSSGSLWNDAARNGPSTPYFPFRDVRVYTTPGRLDVFEESLFDPTSTPSRGIRLGGPFATPKNNMWSARAAGLFQTPSRPSRQSTNKLHIGSSSSSALDESGGVFNSPHRTVYSYDDTPIRRTKSGEIPRVVLHDRRIVESPPAPRLFHHLLEESPVSKGISRSQDLPER